MLSLTPVVTSGLVALLELLNRRRPISTTWCDDRRRYWNDFVTVAFGATVQQRRQKQTSNEIESLPSHHLAVVGPAKLILMIVA